MRLATFDCKKPAALCSPCSERFCLVSSPITDTWTLACRISPETSTWVTVTSWMRGSLSCVRMAMLTTSRMASAALSTRRDDIGQRLGRTTRDEEGKGNKFQIPNSKSQTNSESQHENASNAQRTSVWNLMPWNLEFV